MATTNNRLRSPQANIINGISAGGLTKATLQEGYENRIYSAPDGLQIPLKDKEVEYVRGTIITQDWVHALELLTGTVGTCVFYERKSGTAAESGYVLHTITNPVIHRFNLSFAQGGYATCAYDFECRAADETKGITDMHTMTDSQAAPDYVDAARGGYRIISSAHGETSIYHTTAFNFSLALPLSKACNDADVGYTCVDAVLENLAAAGSISFQDASITSTELLAQTLLTAAAAADLVVTARQSQGAANKLITIARVDFNDFGHNADGAVPFTGQTLNFDLAPASGTPLTLEGSDKIITIEDAA